MGLFNSLQTVNLSKADTVIEQIANYYRHSNLYVSRCNSDDAYDMYVSEYSDDIRVMIENGDCYGFKGQYLIAHDIMEFYKSHVEVANHYYVVLPSIVYQLNQNKKPIMYMNAFGPKGDTMDSDSYKLIKQFVRIYEDNYTIIGDITTGIDSNTDVFVKATGGRKFMSNGELYYRWS